ncbi:hypothetical protein Tco_0067488 [Tanacetum coccineum]
MQTTRASLVGECFRFKPILTIYRLPREYTCSLREEEWAHKVDAPNVKEFHKLGRGFVGFIRCEVFPDVWHESQFLTNFVGHLYRWWGQKKTGVKDLFGCEVCTMDVPVGPLWQAERISRASSAMIGCEFSAPLVSLTLKSILGGGEQSEQSSPGSFLQRRNRLQSHISSNGRFPVLENQDWSFRSLFSMCGKLGMQSSEKMNGVFFSGETLESMVGIFLKY